jgi:ACS family hexuronate transporter-like MFS transporter
VTDARAETVEADPPYPWTTAWLVTLVATSTMTISYLDRQVLAVLAPTISEQLHIGETQYGWLQSSFSLAYLACAPFAGRMLERVGIRRGLMLAVLAWTLVSAAHAFASSLALLFVLRILLGAAESPSFPGAAATIARTQPSRARARAVGVLFTGSSIGAMLAPVLATRFASTFGGVQGAFIGVALIGLAWVPCWWLATRSPPIAERLGPTPSRPSAPAPRMLDVLGMPAVRQACLVVIVSSPLFAFVLLWGSKLLHDGYGVAQDDMGQYLWAPPLFYDVGAVVFGHLASVHARKHGARSTPRALLAAAAVLASTFAGVALCTTPWQVVWVCGVAMAGGAGLFAIVTADMINRVGPGLAATAGGVTASAQSIMYVIANPSIGLGVETFGGYGPVAIVIASLVLPGALGWIVWRSRGEGAGLSSPP